MLICFKSVQNMEIDINQWSSDDLCDYVVSEIENCETIVQGLREHKITGRIFCDLSEDNLKEVFPYLGDRIEASLMIQKLKCNAVDSHHNNYYNGAHRDAASCSTSVSG